MNCLFFILFNIPFWLEFNWFDNGSEVGGGVVVWSMRVDSSSSLSFSLFNFALWLSVVTSFFTGILSNLHSQSVFKQRSQGEFPSHLTYFCIRRLCLYFILFTFLFLHGIQALGDFLFDSLLAILLRRLFTSILEKGMKRNKRNRKKEKKKKKISFISVSLCSTWHKQIIY